MDWRYNTIWFDQIDAANIYQGRLKEEKFDAAKFSSVEYAILWHLKSKKQSFDAVPNSENLKFLELNWANFKELKGLTKFPNLRRLETHYCTKLESLDGIQNASKIEFLHINQSKKLRIDEQLLKLKNIKVLCLNSCGDLENLEFLSNFKELIDFRFVDTKVKSGDLNPIIEHPSIRTVGFINKRNFNMKEAEIKHILKEKCTDEFTDKVYKGEYMTFKYRTFQE
ncbi:MAG: hypothetical protein ED555_12860 [Allomuricauda sp.]|nr:MAG: hypothetical protein ED555_12860 [Allomuricauda sp.]